MSVPHAVNGAPVVISVLWCLFSSYFSFGLELSAGQRILPRQGRIIDECKSLFNLPAVEQFCEDRGLKEQHLKIVYKEVMNMTCSQHDDLEQRLLDNSFPRRHAADLATEFKLCTSSIVGTFPSASGGKKLLIELESGRRIETVVIRHVTSRGVRYTVCVSSQVGCARACSFCATGTMNLQAQLPSSAILEQVWLAASTLDHPIRNVVAMGGGEPFDNWNAVHEACRGLTHQCLFALAAKQVTISTVGASPYHIKKMANECTTNQPCALFARGDSGTPRTTHAKNSSITRTRSCPRLSRGKNRAESND